MLQLSELPIETFKDLAVESLNKLIRCVSEKDPNCHHVLPKQEVEELIKLFTSIFTQLSYSIITINELNTILDDEKAKFITDCYLQNKYNLATALLKEHNAEIEQVLDNFDWKLKWIVGSSVSTVLRYPLLQLDLSLTKNVNNKLGQHSVNVELNKDDVDKLILELEKANKLFT